MNKYLLAALSILLITCSEGPDVKKQRFLLKGNVAITERNYESGIKYYEEALRFDSCYVDALNNLGTVFYRQNKFVQAVAYYEQAIQCDNNYWEGYLNRANTYYEINELYRAEQDLNKLKQVWPDTLKVHFALGLVYTKLRDYPQALNAFDRTLELNPENVESLINKATVFYYQKNFSSAESLLLQAIALDSTEANAFNALALISIEKLDYMQALKQVNKALEIQRGQPYFLNNRGYIYLLLGDLAKAEEDINNSMLKDPYNAWVHRNKGLVYMKKQDYTNAIRLLEQSANMDPFVDRVYFYLGNAWQAAGDLKNACKFWKESIQRNETDALKSVSLYCN